MTDIVQGPTGFHLVAALEVVDQGVETAASWAADHIVAQPDLGWIVARYVEADRPNHNGHIFSLADLQSGYSKVVHKPLNMLHRRHHVIGAFTAAKLMDGALNKLGSPPVPKVTTRVRPAARTPLAASLADAVLNPHVETLAAVWKYAFPDEYQATVDAFRQGSAFVSMEAVPRSMTCQQCHGEFAYKGMSDPSYCAHMLASARAPRMLNDPHFVGGGIIIPPTRPGWGQADIKDIAGLIEHHPDEAETLYEKVAASAPHLSSLVWEELMASLLARVYVEEPQLARTFTNRRRQTLAKKGVALPDGSFPIENEKDLANAVTLWAQSKNPSKARAHIIARARALGLTAKLPASWVGKAAATAAIAPPAADPDSDVASAMVCITPPADITAALAASAQALEDAEPDDETDDPDDDDAELVDAEDMHVTLGFFGTCDDDGNVGLDEEPDDDGCSQDQVLAAVAAFAATEAPMGRASISGAGIFDIGGGNSVIYASVDAPGLPAMRERLVAALAAAGVPVSATHGMSPHISLEYSDSDEPSLPKIPSGLSWPVTAIEVWWGDEKHTFDLAG